MRAIDSKMISQAITVMGIAADRLREIQASVERDEMIIKDIRVGNRLINQEANNLHSLSIDIDYEIN